MQARLLILLLLAALLAACSAVPPMAMPPTRTPQLPAMANPAGMAPEEVVTAFYDWYIAYASGPLGRNPMVNRVYRSTGYLTGELVQETDALVAGQRLNYDPFLCAQDIPARITVDPASLNGDQASVAVSSSFVGHSFRVELRRTDDTWLINRVVCHPPASASPPKPSLTPAATVLEPAVTPIPALGKEAGTAGWQVYHNHKYGFRVRYPADWAYQEHVADPNLPPIGPENLQLIVLFMPQAWAGQMAQGGSPEPGDPAIAPLSLEITEGTWEEYRQVYLPPASTEEISLNGLQVVHEEEILNDELHIDRYLIEDPVAEAVRVTFVDYISGFPDRLQGNEAVVETFTTLISTLEFDR